MGKVVVVVGGGGSGGDGNAASNVENKPGARFRIREFGAGCVAGCVASVVGQPFDTIRIRVQTQPESWFAGAGDALAKTTRKEGAAALFRGALPPLLGMGPKNAIGFAANGTALRALEGRRRGAAAGVDGGGSRMAGMGNVMVAGGVAGLAQCLFIVPADRVKIQLQVQGRAMSSTAVRSTANLTLVQCVSALVRTDGVRVGLFRGWWPTVTRQAPAGLVYFSSFEALKRRLGCGVGTTAVAGGCAGCLGYLSTYPLDVLKSAAMAAPPGTPASEIRMVALVRRLRAAHGGSWRWLGRGLGPTLLRGFIINAVNFVVFEWAQEVTRDDRGYW